MTAAGQPSVILADDDPAIRHDFARLIDHDGRLRLVGAAPDGAVAVDLARRLRPMVAVMDLRMPTMDGIEATRLITGATDTKVLVVTTFDLDRDVLAAIRAGATGFLLKPEAPDRLVPTALEVAGGDQSFNATAIAALVAALTGTISPRSDGIDRFTARELDTFRLLATGMRNEEIAEQLFVSTATVKSHVRSIFARTGVRNRTQAVVWAYDHGIVEPW